MYKYKNCYTCDENIVRGFGLIYKSLKTILHGEGLVEVAMAKLVTSS